MTEVISIVGTIAFTLSGFLVGVRKQLDWLGVLVLALLTAIGGGMIRDVMVSRLPIVFSDNTSLIAIILTLFIVKTLLHLDLKASRLRAGLFLLADSIGLVAFSITGAQVGLLLDLNLFGVILLGFVTAVGGGMVRDVLVNDIPIILHQDFYGSIAVLVSLSLYLLDAIGWLNAMTMNLVFFGGLAVRFIAYRYHLTLPKINLP
ncbi:MAG: trimeric intracellular cation channel family protein [Neisseriaceae bacterium]|nr:trimeric intracellular cation channel family protein [Neisseriaceae bacterium]